MAARRKNATRESTATLKVVFLYLSKLLKSSVRQAWLNEHKKNPYPTKGEKIMLAIITKMTLTQVISRCRRMRVGFELVFESKKNVHTSRYVRASGVK